VIPAVLNLNSDKKQRTVAEGLKAAALSQPYSPVLHAWSALAAGDITFSEFGAWVERRDELTFLTIDTTGVCDLVCSNMCYYHPDIDRSKGFAPEDSLKQAIRDSVEHLNLRSLVFAGKEPFLNPRRLFNLLDYAGLEAERSFQTGVVTNGRYVRRFWREVETLVTGCRLDFIDVSIDSGYAAQHDEIRGVQGTFDLAFAATEQIAKSFPEVRLTIPSVLRADNGQGVIELIRLASYHARNFQIQPIQPPPYSGMRPLSADYVVDFLKALMVTLRDELGGRGIEISVELLGIYLMEAVEAGLFDWPDLREDEHGTIYVEAEIEGNRLLLTCDCLPLQAWRLARITYEGAYLAHMHFLQTADRTPFIVGYVQDEPITRLFKKALATGSHFRKVVDSRAEHNCRLRPCWNNCFGGWNGAETEFLTGLPLNRQPRLCTKTENDFLRLLK
jgi:MoaA/NifB/PqqE/SkfB family radical SAM enzyme